VLRAADALAAPLAHESVPAAAIVMMEDHDGAYHAWKRAGARQRVLVHIDGHLDWAWMPDKQPSELLAAPTLRDVDAMLREPWLWNVSARRPSELMHIGNYINPALRDGMVRHFYWVVPDVEFDTQRLGAMFRQMRAINARRFEIVDVRPESIGCRIDGTPLTACRLSALPRIDEPVLLDIDTDFLVADQIATVGAGRELWRQLPWMWPAELVEALAMKGVRSDLVTIAYSVEGGFTPLMYKYLGDELALRLRHAALPETVRSRLAHLRQAAIDRSAGRFDRAIAECDAALALDPDDAAAHFALAYLYEAWQRPALAAVCYRRAVALDASYATAFSNFGPVYESAGRMEAARAEYERVLRWQPSSRHALHGLARVHVVGARWSDAVAAYEKAKGLGVGSADLHRGLGSVYAALRRWPAAIRAWERAIALTPHDARVHLGLGHAYARARRLDDAIAAYRAALTCGARASAVYFRLSALYARTARVGPSCLYAGRGLRRWGRAMRARLAARTKPWLRAATAS
jgi:Flp pilus assembly protein TadD